MPSLTEVSNLGQVRQQGQPSERATGFLEVMRERGVDASTCGDVDAADTAHSHHGSGTPLGVPTCVGGCQYRYSRQDGPVSGWCESPSRLVCIVCGQWHLKRCGRARASRCEYCAEEHRLDVAAIGRSGWTDRPQDRGYWVTLTAPSMAWDRSQCLHSPGVECSGTIGCVADPLELAAWHHGLGLRWSHFITLLRRLGLDVEFFKTWEPQRRGALHAHVMMRVGAGVTERRVRAAIRFASRRPWVNFGPQHKVEMIDLSRSDSLSSDQQVARTAGYCAKYATKSADALVDVQRLNTATGELSVGGFRPWSASRAWGDTMKLCKERRRQWASAGAAQLACAPGAAGAAGALTCNGITTQTVGVGVPSPVVSASVTAG